MGGWNSGHDHAVTVCSSSAMFFRVCMNHLLTLPYMCYSHLGWLFFALRCEAAYVMVVRVKADLKRLPGKWEAILELRQLCASGKGLMVATAPNANSCFGSVKDCRENASALRAVLELMVAAGTMDTPQVTVLADSCQTFLQLAHYPVQEDIPPLAHRDAWSLKRCLTFLRRKWTRAEICKDRCC